MTLAPAAYLGYTVHAGYWSMRHGEFRAEASPAYTATMTALLAGTLLGWFGFYLVKNAIERDRATGVGEILAATPLGSWTYTIGKAISNFMVLATMVGVLLIAVAWMISRGTSGTFASLDVVAVFLVLSLPTLALTAAAAVLFESVPFLRRGLGNVVWFVLFGALLSVSLMSGGIGFDFSGFIIVRESLLAAQHVAFPSQPSQIMSLSAGPLPELRLFPWLGLQWSLDVVLSRLGWLLAAAGLALVAALPFDRFDPARRMGRKQPRRAARSVRKQESESRIEMRSAISVDHLFSAARNERKSGYAFWRLLWAEFRLLVKGQAWLWWLGAGGLLVAQLVAPLEIVRVHLLPVAWIWPLLVWSAMGCRDRLFRTEALVDSVSRPIFRQLPAAWAAGAVLVATTGAPGLARLLMAGELSVAGAAATAILFVPSLALACGAWSGVPRLFEVVYLVIWYAGILNGVWFLDFIGASDEAIVAGTPLAFTMASPGLVALAVLARRRRLRS
jgi:hypothetical protein